MFKQYQIIELTKDINPVIKQGITGVILEIYDENTFEIEFVKEDGSNYEFNGQYTFSIDSDYLK
ncbi:MAG: hypothetical protein JWR02_912 [Mucilaginibacter sp.]|nr:hypothetical protein [Mucilaginibacter sp.]